MPLLLFAFGVLCLFVLMEYWYILLAAVGVFVVSLFLYLVLRKERPFPVLDNTPPSLKVPIKTKGGQLLASSASLPHARGGVSDKRRGSEYGQQSSPRTWGPTSYETGRLVGCFCAGLRIERPR